MAVLSHVKTSPVGDFTGTVTYFNSQGSTTTGAATDLLRPSDWNSAHNFFQTISGQTAGQSTASGTNLVIGGTNGVGVSLATAAGAATLWVSQSIAPNSFFRAFPDGGSSVLAQVGNGSVVVYPVIREGPFSATRADIVASVSVSSSSNSSHAGVLSVHVGLYTLNGSTLSLATSGSTAHQWSNTSNNSLASIASLRRLSVPITVNYTGGQDLWVAAMTRSSTTNANWFTASNVVHSLHGHSAQIAGLIGEATNNTRQWMPGQGIYSATSSVLPSSIGFSQLTGAGTTASISKLVPNVYFLNFSV